MLNENQIKDKINKTHGYIAEEVLKKTIYNGRKVIEGEVGANGIDILTYKEDKKENITHVRPYEIKWNKSPTGTTRYGEQGSTEWIHKKMENLIKAYPNDEKYKKIYKFIKTHNPDTRLIRMKPINDEEIKFEMSTLKSDNDKTIKIDKLDGRSPKIRDSKLNLINPKTEYEKKISKIYKKEKERILKKQFPFLNDTNIEKLQKLTTIKQDDIIKIQKENYKNNSSKIIKGSNMTATNSIEINSQKLEEYLKKVQQFKNNIQEINNDMNSRILSLEAEYWKDVGFEEFCNFFKEKITNRMDYFIDDVVVSQMINKLKEQIEKVREIENLRIGR